MMTYQNILDYLGRNLYSENGIDIIIVSSKIRVYSGDLQGDEINENTDQIFKIYKNPFCFEFLNFMYKLYLGCEASEAHDKFLSFENVTKSWDSKFTVNQRYFQFLVKDIFLLIRNDLSTSMTPRNNYAAPGLAEKERHKQIELTRQPKTEIFIHLASPSYEKDYLPLMENILCTVFRAADSQTLYRKKKVNAFSAVGSSAIPPRGSTVLYVLILSCTRFDDPEKKQDILDLINAGVNVVICLFRLSRVVYLDVEEIVIDGNTVKTIPFMYTGIYRKQLSHEVQSLNQNEKADMISGFKRSVQYLEHLLLRHPPKGIRQHLNSAGRNLSSAGSQVYIPPGRTGTSGTPDGLSTGSQSSALISNGTPPKLGKLVVRLNSAKDLQSQEFSQNPNPYVVLVYRKKSFDSSVKFNDTDPVFNEEFVFENVYNPPLKPSFLVFAVNYKSNEKNTGKGSRPRSGVLGVSDVSHVMWSKDPFPDTWITIVNKEGTYGGELNLSITWLPNN